MSDGDTDPTAPAAKRTARAIAEGVGLWLLIWGGVAALLWFYPLPTLGVIALLVLLRFLSC